MAGVVVGLAVRNLSGQEYCQIRKSCTFFAGYYVLYNIGIQEWFDQRGDALPQLWNPGRRALQLARRNTQLRSFQQISDVRATVRHTCIDVSGRSQERSVYRMMVKIHPPTAVEIELSLFSRHALEKGGVVDTCHELGIPVVGYSPLDRGWLTGQFKTLDDLPKDDFRHFYPRFQPGNFEKNVELAEAVEKVAKKKDTTSAQVAIAWVQRQGVLPIPGSTKASRVLENTTRVELTDNEYGELESALSKATVSGHRYPEMFQSHLDK
ncbi:Aldo/keto reductase [Lophiostoma macrostomum CBS 122681]|uniref:Aldo/keto reductase n=1 Tax=Lophiostoma macrostomum CBS 122681 TaxID=1314788 RepID=A0A6A6T0K6_9PLEO|nr:Aldo/keto reductase [Lophiostoma macrostomum CBS 122681]